MRVKDMPPTDQPRERLLSIGATALADRELLALLLGSGGRGANAVELASHLIAHCGDLRGLARSDPHRLMSVPGIGPAKAARVVAAFHLMRQAQTEPERRRVTCSGDLAAVVSPMLRCLSHERVVAVVCDSGGAVLRRAIVSEGAATTPSPPSGRSSRPSSPPAAPPSAWPTTTPAAPSTPAPPTSTSPPASARRPRRWACASSTT
nr:hypothetical protein GCM10020093_103950 [Planobispora longispora]